jgi:hypothetical protein
MGSSLYLIGVSLFSWPINKFYSEYIGNVSQDYLSERARVTYLKCNSIGTGEGVRWTVSDDVFDKSRVSRAANGASQKTRLRQFEQRGERLIHLNRDDVRP